MHANQTVLWVVLLAGLAVADDKTFVREIFVPFEDLNVVLENAGRRVFLTRDEYEELLKKARQTPERTAPHKAAVISANYEATVENGRTRISGRLLVDIAADGMHAIPLDAGQTSLRSATLDGKPAAISRPDGHAMLFVEGRGQHELMLEFVLPVEVSAALQTIQYQLPHASSNQFRLIVPGNVEIKNGARVVSRSVDQQANVTRFELMPSAGPTALVMTLNNKLTQDRQVVVARNVIVSEITGTYERLHVTSSLKIIHGAAQRFRFPVPDGFEITNVATPQLSKWRVDDENGSRVLTAILRNSTSDDVVLNLSAQRTPATLRGWRMPNIQPLDVAGSVTIVGLVAEDRLKMTSLSTSGLIPIDTETLVRTLPASVFEAEPGAPMIKPLAAYYAPRADMQLTADFEKPPVRFDVTSNLLLVVQNSGLELHGGFTLLPVAETIFGCSLSVESGWDVTSVTHEGQSLAFEQYIQPDGSQRIRVKLQRGVPASQSCAIHFQAIHVPDGWLDQWSSREVSFPQVVVTEAVGDRGAIAVRVGDDLTAQPGQTNGIVPLDEDRKAEFNLADVATNLAYRFETRPFSASLKIERTNPRVTGETYSFVKIDPSNLTAHYEIAYDVVQANTRELSFELPADTPREISIQGLNGAAIKESRSEEIADGTRKWHVQIVEPKRDEIRLAVSFQQPVKMDFSTSDSGVATTTGSRKSDVDVAIPIIRASDVEFQTGFVAVEGAAELDVSLRTAARKVDVGEMAEADYVPGRRLLGAYGFTGELPTATATISRPAGLGLPAAIVERAELVTSFSTSGISQSAARFLLRAKAQFIEIQLPTGSTLWSVYLDQVPAKAQRDGNRLLVGLPTLDERTQRDLQVVYETPVETLGMWGSIELASPKLYFRNTKNTPSIEIPLADLAWNAYLPTGFQLAKWGGTVEPNLSDDATRMLLASRVSAWKKAAGLLLASPGPAWMIGSSAGAMKTADSHRNEIDFAMLSTTDAEPAMDADSKPRPQAAIPEAPASELPTPKFSAGEVDDSKSKTATPGAKFQTGKSWELQGLRSLKIDLTKQGDRIAFGSLGADPILYVTLVDSQRTKILSWATILAVIAVGLALARRSRRAKFSYICGVLLVATMLPPIIGWNRGLDTTCDLAFFSALLLIPTYVLLACWQSLVSLFGKVATTQIATVLVLIAFMNSPGQGEEIVEAEKPVTVPTDAVIIPYDPEGAEGTADARKIIVPYDKYVALWNLAYPDKKLAENNHSATYSFAGASWVATLTNSNHDFFELTGRLDLKVYSEELSAIPLALDGGVLVHATLDGQPARIQFVEPATEPAKQKAAAADESRLSSGQRLATLYVSGPGPKKLELTVRYPLARRGGWRAVQGRVPAVAASGLTLIAPDVETEVRLTGIADRALFETSRADERIETAFTPETAFRIEWRPKVARASVDRGLSVNSAAVFDVREDGLGLTWHMKLNFPLSERDFFSIDMPSDFLLEEVVGDNVRGWEVDGDRLRVTLLKAARDAQELTVRLTRRSVDMSGTASFQVPWLQIAEAAMHEGRLTIRRSPLLEVRVDQADGLDRTDIESTAAKPESVDSPLGIQPFQAFKFSRTPFSLRLSTSRLQGRVTSESQTVLRFGEEERTLESRIVLHAEEFPVYRALIDLPVELSVDRVIADGDFQWSVDTEPTTRVLKVFFARGVKGDASIVVRGRLGERGPMQSVALPRIVARDVSRHESTIVIQTDPSFGARPEGLSNCQAVLIERTFGWLDAEQRPLTRLAVHSSANDFAGTLRLEKRTSRVNVQTVSNVRFTSRTVEDTILIDFSIEDAGAREVAFSLPAQLREAKITAPLLRRKIVEDVDASGFVRVRLELQDEVMGQFRVLIENDRLVTFDQSFAPIPRVETGITTRRFVTLENAGRDELLIELQEGLDGLGRESRQWQDLTGMMGNGLSHAYLVASNASSPRLAVRIKGRQAVETVGGRIPLARAVLAIDSNGAYRGVQTFQVDNSTEQFLELELPTGAALWTAQVAGQPVKPIDAGGVVRIPLVKTAEGELDYPLEVKYGGRIDKLRMWTSLSVPLIRTRNIKVEQSQVRLWLPESHRWIGFGGSMRLADSDADLVAGFLKYKTEQLQAASESLSSKNPFTQLRSRANLKQLASSMKDYESAPGRFAHARELNEQIDANSAAIRRAEELLSNVEQQKEAAKVESNRLQLNNFYMGQSNSEARNIVNSQRENFRAQSAEALETDKQLQADVAGRLERDWIDQSGLGNKLNAEVRKGSRLKIDEKAERLAEMADQRQSAVNSPDVPNKEAVEELKKRVEGNEPRTAGTRRDERSKLDRFEQQLRQQSESEVQQLNADGTVVDQRRGGGFGGGQIGQDVAQEKGTPTLGDMLEDKVDASQNVVPKPEQSTGFVSLDVRLPTRGVEYLFTTPRGEVEIIARAIDRRTLSRVLGIGFGLFAAVGAWVGYRIFRRGSVNAVLSRRFCVVMILVGLVLVALGIVPAIGLITIMTGLFNFVRISVRRTEQTKSRSDFILTE